MWLLNRILVIALLTGVAVSSGCSTLKYATKKEAIKHVYIAPVTNRTPEEGADIFFSKAADEAFYTDSRFMVDMQPIPDETIIIKPTVKNISSYSVGYNIYDQAIEYKINVTATIKLIKYGYKHPFKTFTISAYEFYSAVGSPSEVEQRKKEAIEAAAKKIFRELGEKLLEEESGKSN
ncbi:LPS assembly lipoprotein LptE [Desulfurobacterium atlanticum]|uniref:Lipopolysaccharide-assembly n=1 Tax=Desulfurobacterium atlanticum TaxID=240169 RepID=A0A238YYI6_9BACT|nr:LPS assembly lipoprotein LptE [Desulfurobacterium atlanticum]SNR76286.1 hypothetical protein SAMN06265340_105119 [Desulfurobacterium atlanticum]